MRHKIYTKEQIIKAAKCLVSESGFENFTARNVAQKMGGSTQPIYVHFKNMQELKAELIERLQDDLWESSALNERTGETIFDETITYIELARKYPKIFSALYLEGSGAGPAIYERSFKEFKEISKYHEKLSDLSDKKLTRLHHGIWVASTGMALLRKSGIIDPTNEQQKKLIMQVIEAVLNEEE